MASLILKPKRFRIILLRILSFAALILAVKHSLFLSLAGDESLCIFPDKTHIFFGCLSAKSPPSVLRRRGHREAVDYYFSVFQDLISQGFLSPESRSLCVGTLPGDPALSAMKTIGVLSSAVHGGDGNRIPFESDAFDFEFSLADGQLAKLAPEIERTLKPGGFFVLHTNSTRDSYSFESLLELFDCCTLISAGEIDGLDSPISLREIVMKKEHPRHYSPPQKICSASEIASRAEALIEHSALKKPWREFSEKNIVAVKYLPSMVDISFKRRYVYVDVGAKGYESSIGDWFLDQYPKQGHEFEIFAVESDRSFHGGYLARKKEVTLLPMAAWIRNETLFFEIARLVTTKKRRKKVLGRYQAVVPTASHVVESAEVKGFDFAEWLGRSVSRRDFVVVKMDVGGAEFHLIPKLVETGAICLIDEIFLVCHYDRRKRRVRYRRTYSDCLRLFALVREKGVLVHQWW